MSTRRSNPVIITDTDTPYKEDLMLESDHETGSPPDTPRSLSSSGSSSLLSTPRCNLLWDHGYEVDDASTHCKSPQERAMEWRKFNNKTDDDKLQADLHEQTLGNSSLMLQCENMASKTDQDDVASSSPRLSHDLPDLISSMSSSFSKTLLGTDEHIGVATHQDTVAGFAEGVDTKEAGDVDIEESHANDEFTQACRTPEDDVPPPLPDSTPPTLGSSESPPPLPSSSPPALGTELSVVHNGESGNEAEEVDSTNEEMTNCSERENKNDIEFPIQSTNTYIPTDGGDNNIEHCGDDLREMQEQVNQFEDLLDITESPSCTDNEGNDDIGAHTLPSDVNICNDIQDSETTVHHEDSLSEMQEHVRQFKALLNLTDDENCKSEDRKNNGMEMHDQSHDTGKIKVDEENCIAEHGGNSTSEIQEQLKHFKDMLDKQFDKEVEEEFEAIINALDLNYMDETYVERFAERRDRYGFILSPVVEAPTPSPTLSSMSGYSGLSSVSPDPLSMFRMSPRPSSRTDLDLSSLGIDPDDWDFNTESIVPIYQTFKAMRAVVIPEEYGWDSGDDLLSGSGEWEIGDGALKSPPLSTSSVTLSQFGSHVVGWKQPDSVIMEESENTSGDGSDTDTDETINGDNNDNDDKDQAHDSDLHPDCQSADMSDGTVSGDDTENEFETVLGNVTNINDEDDKANVNPCLINEGTDTVVDMSTLFEEQREFSERDIEGNVPIIDKRDKTITDVETNNTRTVVQSNKTDSEVLNFDEKTRGTNSCYSRTDSNISNQTSEHRSSSDDNEDAEDEMSDTDQSIANETADDPNSDTEFFLQKRDSLKRALDSVNAEHDDDHEDDHVNVTELMSPRTAILLAGGMFPIHDDDSSSLSTDSDVDTDVTDDHEGTTEPNTPTPRENITPEIQSLEPDVQVSQYTSDDSDLSGYSSMASGTPIRQSTNNIKVSFRGKYKHNKPNESPPPTQVKEYQSVTVDSDCLSTSSTPTVSIVSPLDFSIFGDKLDRSNTYEGGRSPRVLGRYYSELDDDVLAQSLSPPVVDMKVQDIFPPTNDDTEPNLHNTDYDDSFRNVDFTLPTNATIRDESLPYETEENIRDNSSNSSESVDSIEDNNNRSSNSESIQASNFENSECERTEPTSTDIAIIERHWEHPVNIKTHVAKQDMRKTPPVTKALNKKHAKAQRKSPVQIKISHLKRKGSTRNKIKKGFVQQLTEIFVKNQSETNDEPAIEVTKRKPRESDYARVRLPQQLTANENVIINSGPFRKPEITETEDANGSSLGFDFSNNSLAINSDNDKLDVFTDDTDSGSLDENQDNIPALREVDETENTDIKMYEERLREFEGDTDDILVLNPSTIFDTDIKVDEVAKCELDEINNDHQIEQPVTHSNFGEPAHEEMISECVKHIDKQVLQPTIDSNVHVKMDTKGIGELNEILANSLSKKPASNLKITHESTDMNVDENEYYNDMKLFKKWISEPKENEPRTDSCNILEERYLSNVSRPQEEQCSREGIPELNIPKRRQNSRGTNVATDISEGAESQKPLSTFSPTKARIALKHQPGDRLDDSEDTLNKYVSDLLAKHYLFDVSQQKYEKDEQQNSSSKNINISESSVENTTNGCDIDQYSSLLDEKRCSTRKRSFLKDRMDLLSKLDLPDDSEKLQYPPSLSRRLYGPFVRQRERSPNPFPDTESTFENDERINNTRQRDVTRTTLPHTRTATPPRVRDSCQTVDAANTVNITEKRQLTERPFHAEPSRYATDPGLHLSNPGTPHREVCYNDKNADAWIDYELSQLDIDNNVSASLNADIFQHTLYEVATPVSRSPSIREDVPLNLRSITRSVSNEGEPLHHRENNFANANIRSSEWPRAVNITDAGCDKLQPDFSESSCLNETGGIALPVKPCVDNSYSVSDTGRLRGVFTRSRNETRNGELTNGIFQQKMGVFPATENSVSDDTLSCVTMKENGPLNQATSVEGKVSSLGINDSTSTATVAVNQAYMSTGEDLSREGYSHGEEVDLARNVPAVCTTRDKHVSVVVLPPDCQHVLEDEKGNLKVWPYSDFKNSEKLPVTLHTAKHRVKRLPNMIDTNSSSMKVIQSAQHSAEMPENKMVKKYHSSSVMPTANSDTNIMQTHSDSIKTVLMQDANGNMVSEEELTKILPKLADLVSKMETTEAEEILPGITQSVTKLRNGGNLVITTMTRKVDEVESDSSSGRASPEPSHPVLNVDDLESSKIYLVEDSHGEMFYVEDITSDTQESAYFSSSRNTSESISDGANSPSFKRISKVHQVGDSGIHNATAEEILSAMYNDGTVQEINENEEEWSERTYEYEIPKRRPVAQTNGYSKDTFNTSYVVEEPDTMPRTKTTTKDKFESFYEMAGNQPWVADGGQMQSYSEATHVLGVDKTDAGSAVGNVDNYTYRTIDNNQQASSANRSGYTNTQESYTVDAESQVYPMVPYQYPTPAPLPVFMPPPPVCIQAENPQYSLVKVKVTPPPSEESVTSRVDVTQHNKTIEIDERPIYKTVAHIQTGEKHPPAKSDMSMAKKKTYKLISSKASPVKEEEQESHMSFGEVDYRYTTENVEVKQSPTVQTKQFFVRDSTRFEKQEEKVQSEQRFRSEKTLDFGSKGLTAGKANNTTTIDVRPASSYAGNGMETYEERSYSFDQMKASVEPAKTDWGDMRVIRGSYLIKNNLDEVDGELDDNINMFDGNFVLSKENPLYQSDEDLYRKLDREKAEHAQKQDRFQRDYRQDVTFETVDKFSKSKTVKREEVKPKQSITEMLLSKLATIDSKDIHQKIDVKHHAEDIYGDPRFLHADGVSVKSQGTNDFDTVGEKVDLLLKEGKAFITVKVTAERITPVDMEFNVWRKNQAIVTRIIEVDLLATEQRRRLYYKVMEEQASDPRTASRRDWRAGPNETILDGHQTLELFSRILGAAEGEGDKEDITVKTRLTNTSRPFSSGMDLLY